MPKSLNTNPKIDFLKGENEKSDKYFASKALFRRITFL
jgi:hypothetical protein